MITGTSVLAVDLHDQVTPQVVATTTLDIPAASRTASEILQRVWSDGFTIALECISADILGPPTTSVGVKVVQSTLVLTLTTLLTLDGLANYAFPWRVDASPAHLKIDANGTSETGMPGLVSWASLEVDLDGGNLYDAAPVPTAELDSKFVRWAWAAPVKSATTAVELDLPVVASMKIASAAADHGDLQSDSDSVSDMSFAGLVLILLGWALKRSSVPKRGRIFVVGAGVLTVYVASTSGSMYANLLPRQWSQAIPLLAAIAGAVVAAGLYRWWLAILVAPVGFSAGIAYALASQPADSVRLGATVVMTSTLLTVAWFAVGWLQLSGGVRHVTRASLCVIALLLCANTIYPLYDGTFGAPSLGLVFALDLPVAALTTLALPAIIVLALARADGDRVACRRLAALAAATATWLAFGNGQYLGISLPVPALLTLVLAVPAWRFGQAPGLDELQREVYSDPRWPDTWRSELFLIQTRIAALRRAAHADANGAAPTSDTLAAARDQIKTLRCIPPTISTTAVSTAVEPRRELPPRVDPIDLVRAYGPAGPDIGAIGAALRVASLPAAAATVVLLWTEERLDLHAYLQTFYTAPLWVGLNIAALMVYWLVPVAILASTWRLFKASGSARAMVIWSFTGVPPILHLALLKVFDQPADAFALIRSIALLFILLVSGMVLDAQILRTSDDGTRLALGAFRIVNARPVMTAVTTLVIPLVTAGIAVWTQVEAGIGIPQTSQSCLSTQSSAQVMSPSGKTVESSSPTSGTNTKVASNTGQSC